MDKKSEALKRFVEKVKELYGSKIEKIILFGSYARGESREDSDIDLLIISSGGRFKMQKKLSEIAVGILLDMGVYISAKAVSVEEYNFMKRINSGFYQSVKREGIEVG
jgi:predicted nucleotidyltransferase